MVRVSHPKSEHSPVRHRHVHDEAEDVVDKRVESFVHKDFPGKVRDGLELVIDEQLGRHHDEPEGVTAQPGQHDMPKSLIRNTNCPFFSLGPKRMRFEHGKPQAKKSLHSVCEGVNQPRPPALVLVVQEGVQRPAADEGIQHHAQPVEPNGVDFVRFFLSLASFLQLERFHPREEILPHELRPASMVVGSPSHDLVHTGRTRARG